MPKIEASLTGKVVGETKVKLPDVPNGMKVVITLDSGVHLEVSSISDVTLFNKLSELAKLEKRVYLTIGE